MFITIIFFLLHIAGLLSSINAIMTTRTSQGAIAWAVSLNTFPIIAVPTYWVLGRNRFQGYTAARQSTDAAVQEGLKDIFDELKPYFVSTSEMNRLAHTVERLTAVPHLKGNDVKLLIGCKTANRR